MTSNPTISSSTSSSEPPKLEYILWSGIIRNDVILVQAGGETDGSVTQTAQELLNKSPTPGFEFHTQSGSLLTRQQEERLKGIKFHLYEHDGDRMITWVFAAVYRSALTKRQIQSWLEKIVVISERFREDDKRWRFGGTLAAQATFEPILFQRMQEVTYYGKISLLEERLESTMAMMEKNIEVLLEREEKLQKLNQDASNLEEAAQVFKKRTKKLRRMKMMQDAKYGLLIGAAVTAGVAIIVIPPLVAIL